MSHLPSSTGYYHKGKAVNRNRKYITIAHARIYGILPKVHMFSKAQCSLFYDLAIPMTYPTPHRRRSPLTPILPKV